MAERPRHPQHPAVRNAANPREVRAAQLLEERREDRYQGALKAVMQTEAGRVVMAHLIRRAGVMRSIWDQSSAVHYNAGQQDFGHHIVADLVVLEEGTLYQRMEREAWDWNRREQREINATHTSGRARTQEGDENG